ncbi:MAG: hypothetical protein ACP5G4_10540, partial [bacterium]
DFQTQVQLDKWLEDHRVTLDYEGKSYREPMMVSRFEEGYWKRELVGDNTLPEGRLVNRRVVLEIKTVTE